MAASGVASKINNIGANSSIKRDQASGIERSFRVIKQSNGVNGAQQTLISNGDKRGIAKVS